jgi:hypothetical protein
MTEALFNIAFPIVPRRSFMLNREEHNNHQPKGKYQLRLKSIHLNR